MFLVAQHANYISLYVGYFLQEKIQNYLYADVYKCTRF